MRKSLTTCTMLIMLASGFGSIGSAQTSASEPFKIPVSLDVTASDEALKDRVISLVSVGLRALGDVVIVDDRPRFLIHIVGVGNRFSYGLAVEFTQRYDLMPTWRFFLDHVLPPGSSRASTKEMAEATNPLIFMAKAGEAHLAVNVYRGSEIEQTSKDVVANFDTNILIPDRKGRQALGDTLKDALPKK
jgi:hypothetical protein